MRHRIEKIPTLSKLHHLLHSDKSANRGWFIKTLFLGARPQRLSLQGCGARPRCNSGSPTKKVFTKPARAYFYNDKLSNKLSFLYSHKFSTIPLVLSSIALLLVFGIMINPIANNVEEASAATEQDFGAGRKISLTITNNGTTLADNATVSEEVKPGVVSYIENIIKINTSNIAKYYVGVQAASDGSSTLTGTTHKQTIAGVGSKISPANFGDNTWGYNLSSDTSTSNSSLTYSTLPAYGSTSPLQYTSAANPSNGNHYLKLTFAAKINANRPADHYTTKAMVSVAADAKTLTLSDLTYMQQMTKAYCDEIEIGSTGRLKDGRDGKYYWVSKLNDGQCWMTQNLDLDLNGVTLTSDNSQNKGSDLASGTWTSTTGASAIWNSTDSTIVKYYDPGYKTMANGNGSPASVDASLVTGTTANTSARYTQGNYYSFNAATLESGKTVTSNGSNTSKSVCPKGWKLPLAGRNSSNSNKPINTVGTFANMLEKYGWSWTKQNDSKAYWYSGNLSSTVNGITYKISANPFYFVYSGYIQEGKIDGLAVYGGYWAATAYSTNYAYSLDSTDSTTIIVNPSGANYRYRGYSVRCVVR